ncbi:hypothetical protein Tco_1565560, partial [Tanacetum coccineum]
VLKCQTCVKSNDMRTKEKREIGAKHETLVDVFIANRLSKASKRFGFLRYIRVKDLDKLVNLLREECIGNFHLFASKPRFLRKSFVASKQTNTNISKPSVGNSKGINGLYRSFANVISDGHKNENTAPKKIERKVLMGVGVSTTEVQHMAATIRYEATTLPFVYLGVPVGENMTRVKAWKDVIDKLIGVRISQKSQENSQKRANTDTRIRKVQSRSPKRPKP